jgi:hypothetical protein
MFNQHLHRRLDGEEKRELRLEVLESFYGELRNVVTWKGWEEDEGLRYVLAAGVRAIAGWKTSKTPLERMTPEEKLCFFRDRLSSVEAAYAAVKFQAYQVMQQNDALSMNLTGLLPQLEAANRRVLDLEEEVRRLRALVPPEIRQGSVLVRDPQPEDVEDRSLGLRIRAMFTRGHH